MRLQPLRYTFVGLNLSPILEIPMLPLRLHHIGQAVPGISAAAARLIRAFGYHEATPILHDPLQTALVQFLLLPPETVYLELVAPDSPQSKLTHAARRGGSLHHLCYLSGPLDLQIAALEAEGLRLISDPTPAVAFDGRRICWLLGPDQVLIELVERRTLTDPCTPISP